MDDNWLTRADCLAQARQLVTELEAGNEAGASRLLDDLTRSRDDGLFQELGKLTRELHEALNSFQLDSRVSDLAQTDIPDAQERLSYVITMTEQAAHRTLSAVEEALPVSDELKRDADELLTQWQRFRRRDMSIDEFRALSSTLDDFFSQTSQRAASLSRQLSEVLMAQDFQDLTGQIIRKVITLVKEVEENLVSLVRISGARMKATDIVATTQDDRGCQGPTVPGVDSVADVVSGQDDVDDILSSLGF
ncbi:MAG: protein phosphatase CheZ [Gammaproteobacteria bacterium]|jgi:chemotaxis protein CheZ